MARLKASQESYLLYPSLSRILKSGDHRPIGWGHRNSELTMADGVFRISLGDP